MYEFLRYWLADAPPADLWLGRAVGAVVFGLLAAGVNIIFSSRIFASSDIYLIVMTVVFLILSGRASRKSQRRNRELRASAGSRPKQRYSSS